MNIHIVLIINVLDVRWSGFAGYSGYAGRQRDRQRDGRMQVKPELKISGRQSGDFQGNDPRGLIS